MSEGRGERRREEWTEEQLIADVENGPQGPAVGAFFDFDGTLTDGYSLAAFARHHLRSGQVSPTDLGRMLLIGLRGVTTEEDFADFFILGMRAWAGRREDELAELGERLFVQAVAGSLYPEGWRLVEAHRRARHTVVLASSATRFQVEPVARAMGVEHVLVTPVEFENGICTGRPGGPPLWQAGKATAVAQFAAAHGVDLARSYAYSNGSEDVAFLSTVGRPRALNPVPGLAATAAQRGWPVARFAPRGRPGAVALVRTAAGLGGMACGFGAGVVLGALGGSRRDAIDLGTTLAGELGTALAGVRLDVRGAEHLTARPAVFLFNHQSQLDVLILAKLLHGGFTGVAKKELASTPGLGLAFRLADVAFVDRGNPEQARKALEPAVARLREGISLVIAPEGTRSATPALGPFKKGAFHVAMQAGVPLVSVVIRNAGELMWRGSSTIRSGTVQVTVLPPVPTDGWTVAELDVKVAQIRQQYVTTLGDWTGTIGSTTRVSATPDVHCNGSPIAIPLAWGTAPEMNPLETAMWRGEAADPRLRANVTLLELLDRAPEWDRLVRGHEWASRMVPRMRQRVVEPALGVGAPTWATVEDFDLDVHLRRVALPAPGAMRQLLDVVARFAAAPLDRERPLWEVLLVTGLPGGGAGYVVKTHHSATDGLGAVQLMGQLHSRTPQPDRNRPEPAAVLADGGISPLELLARQVERAVRGAPETGAGLLGSLVRPRRAASRMADVARSLGRVVNPPGDGSPLLAARSDRWHFEVLEVELAALKAGARAGGGSLGDGYLAAVLGGFRRYHERMGVAPGPLSVGIPISLRTEDDPQGGNRFTGARFAAPMSEPDPVARIRAVREFVLTAKVDAAADAATLLGPALSWLPGPLLGAVSGRLTSANDVQVSNVPGIAAPVYLAGSAITRMYPFGPLPGCAAMVTLISHVGTCCIGINLDPAAVTEPGLLTCCLQEGIDEIVGLAG